MYLFYVRAMFCLVPGPCVVLGFGVWLSFACPLDGQEHAQNLDWRRGIWFFVVFFCVSVSFGLFVSGHNSYTLTIFTKLTEAFGSVRVVFPIFTGHSKESFYPLLKGLSRS